MTVTLYHSDCLQVMPTLADASVDMVLCDLPYGTTACKWDVVIPFAPLWEQYRRVVKRNGAIVLFGSQPFTSLLVASNLPMFRYEWVWLKNRGSNFAVAKYQPLKEHENVCVFYRERPTYNPQMQERTGGGLSRVQYPFRPSVGSEHHSMLHSIYLNPTAKRLPSSWQKFNTEVGLHPTQKPVALCEYLIRTYTNEGETVLDNTMGSGSTGVAAVNMGRDFIGIEKSPVPEKPVHPKDNPDYFGTAKSRIEAAQSAYRQFTLEGVA